MLYLFLLTVLSFLSGSAQAEDIPFNFHAPFPEGMTYDGGGNGSYYNEGYHTSSSKYCIDFNRGHTNTDLGDSIVSIADGTVVAVGDDSYGTVYSHDVAVLHEDGYYSLYMHLASSTVNVGDSVASGQQIGTLGNTGTVYAHLHFCLFDSSGQSVMPSPMDGTTYGPDDAGNDVTSQNVYQTCNLTTQPTVATNTPPLSLVVPRTKDAVTTVEEVNSQGQVVKVSTQHYDFHGYYFESSEDELLKLEQCESDTDFSEEVCSPDAGNPLIDNQGSHEYMKKWLTGDVTGDGYDDIVLITHVSGDFKAHVWTANGDGSFNTRVKWLEKSNQHDLYFLGDYDGDGDEDLIRANDDGNETIEWKVHKSNGSTAFASTATTWTSDFGKSVDEDIFLVGDVTGDGKVDIVRGYESSSSSDTCDTDGTVKRWWRIRASGSNDVDDFIDDGWGCATSSYQLGDVDGDNDMDLVQFRVESDDSVRVFVNTSNGSKFNNGDRWKKRFGDSDNWFYVHDINGDGNDDIIRYIKTGGKRVRAAESNGSNGFTGFAAPLFPSKMKMPGAKSNLLFGYFGDITLYDGEEEVCESDVTIQTSSLMGATNTFDDMGISDFDPIKASGGSTLYLYLNGEKRAFSSWNAYTDCSFGSGDATSLTQTEIDVIPTGDSISRNTSTTVCGALDEGDLIMGETGSTVYMYASDKKWAFASSTVFEQCYGIYGWDSILTVPDDVVSSITTASNSISDEAQCGQVFDGYLVKSTTDTTVYYIESGERQPFASSSALTSCGFSTGDIIQMSEYQLNQIDEDDETEITATSCP